MNVAMFVAVAVAYLLAWQPFGFILASSATLLILLLLFGARSVPVILGVVVLVPLALGYLFQGLMNIVLPEGPLGLRF
jgi:ABC-type Fe3+-siderophore transport system permease subunit